MPVRAWLYISTIFCLAIILCIYAAGVFTIDRSQWIALVVLTSFAIAMQLVQAKAPGRQSMSINPVFFFAGALLLQPLFLILLIVASYLIEWINVRYVSSDRLRQWYIQPFNIAVHIISGITASWLYATIDLSATMLALPAPVFIGMIVVIVYTLLNQLLIIQVLVFGRAVEWKDLPLLTFNSLLTEGVMTCLGYVIAVLWKINPWMIIPALAALVPIYQALRVPQLQQEASTDAKTGLMNARYFSKRFADELGRAQRFGRPLACIMADLDFLRKVNNTYGHLAGDAVLADVGTIILHSIRDYDVAARFGGEEFAIILPETKLEESRTLAERIRKAIEQHSFQIPSQEQPIYVTMSFGIACFPEDGTTTQDLQHRADMAVYQAKKQGRNRVVVTDMKRNRRSLTNDKSPLPDL